MDQDTTTWSQYRSHRFPYRLHRGGRHAETPVVFLGGAFQTMDSWNRFVTAFQPDSDVLLVDLPGSGTAPPLPAEAPISLLSDALADLLDTLDIERIYLIAASYGTPAAYQFAQRHAHRVERMALCGTMRAIPEHVRGTIERSVRMALDGDLAGLARECVDGLLSDCRERPVRRARLAKRILMSGVLSMTAEDRRRYALNTSRLLKASPLDLGAPPETRLLAFTGEHDAFTTPARVREVAQSVPGAAFTLIREADHLCHLERFDTVVELLKQFRADALQRVESDDWLPVDWTASDLYCPA